jgi:hypothetical protein
MELEVHYEAEEIGEEEFQAQEKKLLERLNAIRERKKDEQFEEDEAWWRRVFPEGFEQRQKVQITALASETKPPLGGNIPHRGG